MILTPRRVSRGVGSRERKMNTRRMENGKRDRHCFRPRSHCWGSKWKIVASTTDNGDSLIQGVTFFSTTNRSVIMFYWNSIKNCCFTHKKKKTIINILISLQTIKHKYVYFHVFLANKDVISKYNTTGNSPNSTNNTTFSLNENHLKLL